jgi:uncharacterized protein (TIRG00374 family)
MNRTAILLVAKAAISALLIAAIVRFLDVEQVFERLRASDGRYVIVAYLLLALVITLSALRWHILANGLLDRGQAMRYTWIGAFFGHVLPGGVSGDIAKGVSIAIKHPETRGLSLPASIVVDKIVGFVVLVALFAVACIALFVSGRSQTEAVRQGVLALLALSVFGLGGVCAALALVATGHSDTLLARVGLAHTLVGRIGLKVTESLRQYARAPALLWRAAGISLVIQLCNMGITYATLRAVGVDAPWLLAAVAYPVVAVAVMLPITVSGIGVREIMMIACFTLFGLGKEAAVAQAWLSILMTVPVLILGALLQLAEVFSKRSRAAP